MMTKKVIGSTDAAIASRFTTFRKDYIKLSQTELADDLGMAQKTISFIETGRTTPNRNVIVALSNKYKLNSEWLMKGVGSPVNNQKANPDAIASIQARISIIETQVAKMEKTLNTILSIVQSQQQA